MSCLEYCKSAMALNLEYNLLSIKTQHMRQLAFHAYDSLMHEVANAYKPAMSCKIQGAAYSALSSTSCTKEKIGAKRFT